MRQDAHRNAAAPKTADHSKAAVVGTGNQRTYVICTHRILFVCVWLRDGHWRT